MRSTYCHVFGLCCEGEEYRERRVAPRINYNYTQCMRKGLGWPRSRSRGNEIPILIMHTHTGTRLPIVMRSGLGFPLLPIRINRNTRIQMLSLSFLPTQWEEWLNVIHIIKWCWFSWLCALHADARLLDRYIARTLGYTREGMLKHKSIRGKEYK